MHGKRDLLVLILDCFMILILLFVAASLIICIDTIRLGISPMPSSKKAKKTFLSLVQNKIVYEMGSGWGGLAIALARENSVRAFEMSAIPWFYSLLQKSICRAKNLTIERKDFFSQDLKDADVIICYLFPKAMEKLVPKFEKELKKGTIVLSNSFQLPGKKADQIFETGDIWNSKIYCYRF